MIVARPPVGILSQARVCCIARRRIHAQGVYDAKVPENILSTRMDSWIAEQLPNASRARVQDSIRKGFATVNGKTVTKPSFAVEGGDHVVCTLCGAAPLEAKPENIQLDIVHEDDHIIIVNKSADMVVHPAPGHSNGTLVNAILHHCGLPAVQVSAPESDNDYSSEIELDNESDDDGDEIDGDESDEDEEIEENSLFRGPSPVIRPGIVHRLDKGTTGLLVIAKNEQSQLSLSQQFKARKARRTYLSLICGTPSKMTGRVEAAIVRDPRDRKRMTTADNVYNPRRARFAASRYNVIDVLANGGASLVEWKLETGRTHQIRVHARYIGYPILGDEVYGGTHGLASSKLISCLNLLNSTTRQSIVKLVGEIRRPCLHAYSLGFRHPATRKRVHFTCPPPPDFEDLWKKLRDMRCSPDVNH